jgi:acetyl esterase/lipase
MQRIRKYLCFVIALVLTLSLIPANTVLATAAPDKSINIAVSTQNLVLDGKGIKTQAYNINGSNYCKLRDIAYLLNGTDAQFSVNFDAKNFQITTISGAAYVKDGSELSDVGVDNSERCKASTWTLLVNGTKVDIKCYVMNGNNFFSLKDLSALFGFGLKYDQASNTTEIVSTVGYTMNLSDYSNMWTYQKDSNCYSLKDVVYCSNPVDPSCEHLNIYVPAAYMNPDSSLTDMVVNGYYADTAPIFMPTGSDNYQKSTPLDLSDATIQYALSKGYVVVAPSVRGNDSTANGANAGLAPAALVDLKAAVRFLKHNDQSLSGNSELIVTDGTSTGGTLSALLGVTGDAKIYDSYLNEIGAIMTESDAVYASAEYCPILDQENAEAAYQWMFGTDTSAKTAYATYINSLGLKNADTGTALSVGSSDTYTQYLLGFFSKSLTDYLNAKYKTSKPNGPTIVTTIDSTGAKAYIASIDPDGTLITVNYDTLDAKIIDLNSLVKYMAPGKDDYAGLAAAWKTSVKGNEAADKNGNHAADLYNPMNYIADSKAAGLNAKYFYVRSGSKDTNTAATGALNFATALKNAGGSVNYAVQWGYGHNGSYELADLFAWTERICKYEESYSSTQIENILNLKMSIAGGTYSWTYHEAGYSQDQGGPGMGGGPGGGAAGAGATAGAGTTAGSDTTASAQKGTWHDAYYSISSVTAVANPELKDYEGLSICIPAAYVSGIDKNGSLIFNYSATVNTPNGATYTAATAPIIINTGAAGYSSSTTSDASPKYVSSGYINVACGNRGKNNVAKDAEGKDYYCGDSPYCLVDQKAVVRWLKYNINLGNVPGDAKRIVSTGGSGGGAHSLMLAATGNHSDFYPYLERSGAVGVSYNQASNSYASTISDAIWGCCPYSPITNLEEADMAYEWEASISKTGNDELGLSQFKRLLSTDLSKEYIKYVNNLGLKYDVNNDGVAEALTINADGTSGTYVDFMVNEAKKDLNWFLNNVTKDTAKCTWALQGNESYAEAYFYGHYSYTQDVNGLQLCGDNLSDFGFTLKKDANGKWSTDFNVSDFMSYRSRSKTAPAFDTLTLKDKNGDYNAENLEFGDSKTDAKHWDKYVLQAFSDDYEALNKLYVSGVDANETTFAQLYQKYSDNVKDILAGDKYSSYTGNTIVELYNPLRYILDKGTEQPSWVRLIHGTLDKDVSLMATQNDAVAWNMMGVNVELDWSWDNVHVATDPLNTSMEAYIDSMSIKEDAG